MDSKNFLDSINIAKQCRKYNLSIWQCPQFLFLILGLVVITSSLAIYFIGIHYSDDPEIVALIILFVSAFLIIIYFSIIKSFERLAEVAKMKSEFVSIVSHQLRAPLSNLKWIVDLLISGKIEHVSEKQAAYLQILRENSQRMEGLVSDLLIVSRLEADSLPFKNTKTSLVKLVKSLILRVEPFIKASNIEIKLTIEENLPDILFDYQRMEQAVGNILDNAARYIKGKGNIEVILKKEENWLCLDIKDNGRCFIDKTSYTFRHSDWLVRAFCNPCRHELQRLSLVWSWPSCNDIGINCCFHNNEHRIFFGSNRIRRNKYSNNN